MLSNGSIRGIKWITHQGDDFERDIYLNSGLLKSHTMWYTILLLLCEFFHKQKNQLQYNF